MGLAGPQAALGEQSLLPLYFVGAFFLILAALVGRCARARTAIPPHRRPPDYPGLGGGSDRRARPRCARAAQ